MQGLAIVALSVAAAVAYGIVHDQITARVCVEYFTIGHPRIIAGESPTILALAWGVVATWWVGLGLGLPLAFASRVGRHPRRDARSLVRPILTLLTAMAASATLAGIVGVSLARSGRVDFTNGPVQWIPAGAQVGFVADAYAHLTSYGVGFLGGLVVIVRVWLGRAKLPTRPK